MSFVNFALTISSFVNDIAIALKTNVFVSEKITHGFYKKRRSKKGTKGHPCLK
jgi:hypothetical protein